MLLRNTLRKNKNSLSQLLLIVWGLSLLLTGLLTGYHLRYQHRIDQKMKVHARKMARQVALQINQEMSGLIPLATALADDLTNRVIRNEQDLLPLLERAVKNNPKIFAFGAAFEPGVAAAYGSDKRLYSPYYGQNKEGEFELRHTGDGYDYSIPPSNDPNAPNTAWYHDPLTGGAMWNEPYFGSASQAFLAEYAVPFYRDKNDKELHDDPQGLVFIAYRLDGVQDLLDELELGKTGYGFILSKKGAFIAHPLFDEYVRGKKTIVDLTSGKKNDPMDHLTDKALKGDRGIFTYRDPMTRQLAWLVYEPIPSTGWSLGLVFFKEVSASDQIQLGRQQVWILLSGLIFLLLGMMTWIARRYPLYASQRRKDDLLWKGGMGISLASLLALGGIWFLVLSDQLYFSPQEREESQGTIITDKLGLDRYLEQKARLFSDIRGEPIYLQTGIFVQSLEFTSTNNVFWSGYIWQKYQDQVHDGLAHGFVLPEAISSNVKEVSRKKQGDIELIRWRVEATLRQDFDYSTYPFDEVVVWIRLWPENFDQNVILTPDLAAYRSPHPKSLPGLSEDFVLNGLTQERSFFNYQTHRYNTNFGDKGYVGQENFPELYFNIAMKRNFLDAFVGHLSPLLVVAFILFGTLMSFTRHPENNSLAGYTTLDVLGACATLFFVVLLGHIQLREEFGVPQVMYLEYFYFVLYFAILGVSVCAMVFSSSRIRVRWLDDHDGLAIKLLYWPLILGSMTIITLGVFY